MTRFNTRKGGFTLIELMIVVAIIGILAAIAIPNFLKFQLKAKSTEGKTNLAAIRTAEEGYMSEFGQYVVAAVAPTALPGNSKAVFPAVNTTTPSGFDTIGWRPEGNVYFQYAVVVPGTTGFTATAVANIDGDTTNQTWGYVKGDGGAVAPCAITGVYNPSTSAKDLMDTVGPCDATSGSSVF